MTATFYVGDAVTVMNTLPEKSVDLVLTSPPFLALRSYLPSDHPDKALEGGSQATPGAYIDWLLDVVEACARVLAPHGSLCFELGDTYSGSVNFDTTYSLTGSPEKARGTHAGTGRMDKVGDCWPLAKSLSLIPETFRWAMVYGHNPHTGRTTAPWRLRNVIRWVRPNPPVGALGDKFRPATSELMVFCKAKDRFFDLDAVREPHQVSPEQRRSQNATERTFSHIQERGGTTRPLGAPRPDGFSNEGNPAGAPPLDWWNIPSDAQVRTLNYVECGCTEGCMMDEAPDQFRPATSELLVFCKSKTRFFDLDAVREPHKPESVERGAYDFRGLETGSRNDDGQLRAGLAMHPNGAPPLDWWNIPPGGYPGAHYAVWPPELLVKPIKAMCPEKVCRRCGEARRRIVGEAQYVQRRDGQLRPDKGGRSIVDHSQDAYRGLSEIVDGTDQSMLRVAPTLGFTDCSHDDYRPGLVLDPFAGSGTTLAVATGHGRDAVGIDLDERNYELSLDRVGPLILQRGEIPDGAAPKS